MGVCLDRRLVEKFAAGTCSDDEQQAAKDHLAECELCRACLKSARLRITSSHASDVTRVTGKRSLEKTIALDEPPAEASPKPGSSSGKKQGRTPSSDITCVLGNEDATPTKPASMEKTCMLGSKDTAPTGAEPEMPLAGGPGTAPVGDQTLSLTDVDSDACASQSAASSGDGQNFAKALESMIAGYEVLEEMPRGGQAAVYKAIHTATKTKVAIKVLLPTLLASARARHYFEREAELIASLDHPNIISIRDSGIIHQQYYFVMQYVDGQPLERYARRNKLPFRDIVLLFSKICTAITYAHQQGVIHRDLKSANILVDKRGEPHVLDFGLAKATGLSEKSPDKAVVTVTGQLSGTLSTMSPEQAAGRPDLIDVRTDVYSLGIILYHMLTGQYPYDVSGSTLEALKNIQQADLIRPRQIDRKFNSDVEAILLTALAKDPAERYQSTAEFKSDIQHWLEGRPIRVKSISTLYLLRKIITRHRYTSSVAALLLLIIIGFAYTCFDLYVSAEKARKELVVKTARLSAQTEARDDLTKSVVFTCFLNAWVQDDPVLARVVFGFLSEGGKEKQAARFLADPSSVAKKAFGFRRALSEKDGWFAEFIIGENHLKNGDHPAALAAFKRSDEAIRQLQRNQIRVDGVLAERIKQRLDELDTESKATEAADEPEAEE
jgi:serine/threonine protein kinase